MSWDKILPVKFGLKNKVNNLIVCRSLGQTLSTTSNPFTPRCTFCIRVFLVLFYMLAKNTDI